MVRMNLDRATECFSPLKIKVTTKSTLCTLIILKGTEYFYALFFNFHGYQIFFTGNDMSIIAGGQISILAVKDLLSLKASILGWKFFFWTFAFVGFVFHCNFVFFFLFILIFRSNFMFFAGEIFFLKTPCCLNLTWKTCIF